MVLLVVRRSGGGIDRQSDDKDRINHQSRNDKERTEIQDGGTVAVEFWSLHKKCGSQRTNRVRQTLGVASSPAPLSPFSVPSMAAPRPPAAARPHAVGRLAWRGRPNLAPARGRAAAESVPCRRTAARPRRSIWYGRWGYGGRVAAVRAPSGIRHAVAWGRRGKEVFWSGLAPTDRRHRWRWGSHPHRARGGPSRRACVLMLHGRGAW